jgi:hypothetical protein
MSDKKTQKNKESAATSEPGAVPAAPLPPVHLSDETVEVSLETLEATPARALELLRGIGKYRTIRARLARVGYTGAEHDLGWDLLQRASGYHREQPPTAADDGVVGSAATELEHWNERIFTTAGATLKHRFPAQNRFLFGGLTTGKGLAAAVSSQLFLDRIDQMETGESRPDTHAADLAAVALLAGRILPPKERQRIRALIKTARSYHEASMTPEDLDLQSEEQHIKALRELRAWYEEWSTIARANITAKEDLIHLGLAQRKKSKKKAPPAADDGKK